MKASRQHGCAAMLKDCSMGWWLIGQKTQQYDRYATEPQEITHLKAVDCEPQDSAGSCFNEC